MFQPRNHSVVEVLTYLAEVDTVEAGRVLAAERTGLARMEILAQFAPSEGGRTLPSEESKNG